MRVFIESDIDYNGLLFNPALINIVKSRLLLLPMLHTVVMIIQSIVICRMQQQA